LGYGATLAAGMLGIGLGVGKLSKWLNKSAVVIKYVGGITLIVLGFYLIQNSKFKIQNSNLIILLK
jgi:cytochrome c biogenesis protein CcdA